MTFLAALFVDELELSLNYFKIKITIIIIIFFNEKFMLFDQDKLKGHRKFQMLGISCFYVLINFHKN